MLPIVLWSEIVKFSENPALARTSKAIARATDMVIIEFWKNFKEKYHPFITEGLIKLKINKPKNMQELGRLYQFLIRKYEEFDSEMVSNLKSIKPSIKPEFFKAIEKEIHIAKNFKLMWPCLRKELPKRHGKHAPEDHAQINEIRIWINNHPTAFSKIEELNFSKLGLTFFPEEFVDLKLTQLKRINLSHNLLTALPCGFGKKWKELKLLDLLGNQFIKVPKEIALYCTHLKTLSLSNNPINYSEEDLSPLVFVKYLFK